MSVTATSDADFLFESLLHPDLLQFFDLVEYRRGPVLHAKDVLRLLQISTRMFLQWSTAEYGHPVLRI